MVQTAGTQTDGRAGVGKDAPWPKEKIGGNVYYLNCTLPTRARAPLQLATASGGRGLLPA